MSVDLHGNLLTQIGTFEYEYFLILVHNNIA